MCVQNFCCKQLCSWRSREESASCHCKTLVSQQEVWTIRLPPLHIRSTTQKSVRKRWDAHFSIQLANGETPIDMGAHLHHGAEGNGGERVVEDGDGVQREGNHEAHAGEQRGRKQHAPDPVSSLVARKKSRRDVSASTSQTMKPGSFKSPGAAAQN